MKSTHLAILAALAIFLAAMPSAAAAPAICASTPSPTCVEVRHNSLCALPANNAWLCAGEGGVCQSADFDPNLNWCAVTINRGPENYVCAGPPATDEFCLGGN